jgi:hypothetical protein
MTLKSGWILMLLDSFWGFLSNCTLYLQHLNHLNTVTAAAAAGTACLGWLRDKMLRSAMSASTCQNQRLDMCDIVRQDGFMKIVCYHHFTP